jgi:hypothetical protein
LGNRVTTNLVEQSYQGIIGARASPDAAVAICLIARFTLPVFPPEAIALEPIYRHHHSEHKNKR